MTASVRLVKSDNFAGGGGASLGIEMALGRPPDIAINHDPEVITMHAANHPDTKHFCEDVWQVNPVEACASRPVGLAWFSPDCKHFSKARGGKPVSKKIRGLAWIVVKWAKAVQPRVIILENVEEFRDWGPLDDEGMPCRERKGQTFQRWHAQLQNLGYIVEWRELRACDHGTPTIRKRLFLVARCDGQKIVWPEATHADPKTIGTTLFGSNLKPWRTAAECIDWSIPCPSIFGRKKPLAANTLRRVAERLRKFVIESPEPFIVGVGGRAGQSPERPVGKSLQTITSKADSAIVVPTLVQVGYGERDGQASRVPGIHKPLGTIVAGGVKHAIVSAFLAKHYGGVVGTKVCSPIGTVTATDHHSLVAVTMLHNTSGNPSTSPESTPSSTGSLSRSAPRSACAATPFAPRMPLGWVLAQYPPERSCTRSLTCRILPLPRPTEPGHTLGGELGVPCWFC